MSTFVRISARVFLCVTAVVFSGLLLVGCTGGSGVGGGGSYNPFLLSDGEAWVAGNNGFLFLENYRVQQLYFLGEQWAVVDEADYQINDNILIISGEAGTYDISDNTLTLTFDGESVDFTKAAVTIMPGLLSDGLILPDGQAWVYHLTGDLRQADGYMFLGDGRNGVILNIDYGYVNGIVGWRVVTPGVYEVHGLNIAIDWENGRQSTGTYIVSGDGLTLTLNGETMICAARSGVDIDLTPYL
jgi:hypothetical protein